MRDEFLAAHPERRRRGFLTTRQVRVLELIAKYYETTGEPCPGMYLARRLSVHHSTVQEHLAALHRKGRVLTPYLPAIPVK